MIRIKLLFCIFFTLAFQASYSSVYTADKVIFLLSNIAENQSQLNENNFSPKIFGEAPKARLDASVFVPDTKCYLPNFKYNNQQIVIIQNTLRSTAVQGGTLLSDCAGHRIFSIPIYLQTGNFRL